MRMPILKDFRNTVRDGLRALGVGEGNERGSGAGTVGTLVREDPQKPTASYPTRECEKCDKGMASTVYIDIESLAGPAEAGLVLEDGTVLKVKLAANMIHATAERESCNAALAAHKHRISLRREGNAILRSYWFFGGGSGNERSFTEATGGRRWG